MQQSACRYAEVGGSFREFGLPRFEFFDALLQLSHRLGDFREPGECSNSAQPFPSFESGATREHRSSRDVAADSGLRVDDRIFVNGEVSGNANLSGEQHVLFQAAASGESRLSADDIVLANRAGVANLDQAVDLGSASNARFAYGGSVD